MRVHAECPAWGKHTLTFLTGEGEMSTSIDSTLWTQSETGTMPSSPRCCQSEPPADLITAMSLPDIQPLPRSQGHLPAAVPRTQTLSPSTVQLLQLLCGAARLALLVWNTSLLSSQACDTARTLYSTWTRLLIPRPVMSRECCPRSRREGRDPALLQHAF